MRVTVPVDSVGGHNQQTKKSINQELWKQSNQDLKKYWR